MSGPSVAFTALRLKLVDEVAIPSVTREGAEVGGAVGFREAAAPSPISDTANADSWKNTAALPFFAEFRFQLDGVTSPS